jgi:Protein phosphatase 2C
MGASVQGTAHATAGRGCQDAFASNQARALHLAEGVPLVLVACDGASSRPRAAEGATLAVELAMSIFEQRFLARRPVDAVGWNAYLQEAVGALADRFERAADSLARETAPDGASTAADFATTLLVAVASPPWVGLVSVGDGFAVTRAELDGAEHYHLVVPPDPSSAFAGETAFLTSDSARSSCTWALWDPGVTGLALSTDGLTDLALEFEGSRPLRAHHDFFRPWFKRADDPDSPSEHLVRFLAGERVCQQTADDKTLVLAVPIRR